MKELEVNTLRHKLNRFCTKNYFVFFIYKVKSIRYSVNKIINRFKKSDAKKAENISIQEPLAIKIIINNTDAQFEKYDSRSVHLFS